MVIHKYVLSQQLLFQLLYMKTAAAEWTSHESVLSVLNGGTIWESECEGHLWAYQGGCTDSSAVSVQKETEWEDGALTSRCSCAGQTPARCP